MSIDVRVVGIGRAVRELSWVVPQGLSSVSVGAEAKSCGPSEMSLQVFDSIRSRVWAHGGRFFGACGVRSGVVMFTAEDEAKKLPFRCRTNTFVLSCAK